MAMFVAGNARLEPLPFWKWLGMPAPVVMSLPELGLLEAVESVECQ